MSKRNRMTVFSRRFISDLNAEATPGSFDLLGSAARVDAREGTDQGHPDSGPPNHEAIMSTVDKHMSEREPFGGRYWGIWNVEGEGEPIALYPDKADAGHELDRRRALDPEDDDHLTEYHQIFPCDLVGAWWNSYEPDPRADDPLTLDEIVRVQDGDL